MDQFKKHLIAVFVFVSLFWGGYFVLFQSLFGPYYMASYWLRDAQIVKEYIARSARGPKIAIMGGSNALFGMDSRSLQKQIGLEVVNLATHAGLPLKYLLGKFVSSLKSGDIVILSLEYEYYGRSRDFTYSRWFTEQMLAWEKTFYTKLPFQEKLKFFKSFSWPRMLAHVILRFQAKRRELLEPNALIEKIKSIWKSNAYGGPYSRKNLNELGDVANCSGSFYKEKANYPIQSPSFALSAHTVKWLGIFIDYCQRQGILVLATWPCSIKDDDFDFSNPIIQENETKVIRFYEERGVPVLGVPLDFNFERKYFRGTAYHLNEKGKKIRTSRLVQLLQENAVFKKAIKK
jgi:hypothetical protein